MNSHARFSTAKHRVKQRKKKNTKQKQLQQINRESEGRNIHAGSFPEHSLNGAAIFIRLSR